MFQGRGLYQESSSRSWIYEQMWIYKLSQHIWIHKQANLDLQTNMDANKYGSKHMWMQTNTNANTYGYKQIWTQTDLQAMCTFEYGSTNYPM